MKIQFSKYHGTGNDFIIIDNQTKKFSLSNGQINLLCNRHLGIGADGLMLLKSSEDYDFEMQYFNADGGEGTMCGNGGRCITAFAKKVGIIDRKAKFNAIDGLHIGEIIGQKENHFDVKVTLRDITKIDQHQNYFVIDSGSPHYVEFVENIDQIDVFNRGKEIRWDKRFSPAGLNVNFVKQNGQELIVRTFERGVENITLSCGTGVTASAAAADLRSAGSAKKYWIQTFGGELQVNFEKQNDRYTGVSLTGSVIHVFDGEIKLA